MASSSSISIFDNYRFKSAFNEESYNSIVKNKKVIAECCIDLDEDEYPEVKEQISLRGWRRLAAPKQEISIDLIHEFYANAILTEEEMEEAGGHTFRSYVRGKVVDFSPENLRNVMRFRAYVQGAATDFETRKEHDQQLDKVLADLCIPGATWKLSTGQLRVSIQLRQQELNPVTRGWHEFSIHSLIPSSNRSEIPVIRAILIHCIMRGEDVRAEDIIAYKIVRMAQGIKEKGKLGFPSTIFKLCKEAGAPVREFRSTRKIQAENPITARRIESTRDIKGKQQELYVNDDRFYHQVRQEQKEMVQEIQQIKNYQVNQTLVDSTRHKAYMDELAAMKAKQEEFFSNQVNQYNLIRQDHKLLGKEILDVKKYQMSAVTDLADLVQTFNHHHHHHMSQIKP
ncbi:hypothetical protein PIB30_089941 [Stylosanthes scabra]|uniref:Putative plant transposon protein domain-containing protein n=1 Tax=Stylosanthes scabra TaxID=79078 RepID=A0ABU6UV90_9FABA|nr:hypothetical protein [Stylosanthes scabra]